MTSINFKVIGLTQPSFDKCEVYSKLGPSDSLISQTERRALYLFNHTDWFALYLSAAKFISKRCQHMSVFLTIRWVILIIYVASLSASRTPLCGLVAGSGGWSQPTAAHVRYANSTPIRRIAIWRTQLEHSAIGLMTWLKRCGDIPLGGAPFEPVIRQMCVCFFGDGENQSWTRGVFVCWGFSTY